MDGKTLRDIYEYDLIPESLMLIHRIFLMNGSIPL